ncbi:unnamed protein product [Protopolystoma xenopodis]|uniref:Uncharacterized protein n=1 Tax=Protopolystoma xenopodis TaxID=117903 RepID=A0A448WSR3_9PLAT|nr:unnamed protein product [Protopolystoma xenopodis]
MLVFLYNFSNTLVHDPVIKGNLATRPISRSSKKHLSSLSFSKGILEASEEDEDNQVEENVRLSSLSSVMEATGNGSNVDATHFIVNDGIVNNFTLSHIPTYSNQSSHSQIIQMPSASISPESGNIVQDTESDSLIVTEKPSTTVSDFAPLHDDIDISVNSGFLQPLKSNPLSSELTIPAAISTAPIQSTSQLSSSLSMQRQLEYTWRIDLSRTQPFWQDWFSGLSRLFLSVPEPKLLLLAGVDRLDKDLTIGQMQDYLTHLMDISFGNQHEN